VPRRRPVPGAAAVSAVLIIATAGCTTVAILASSQTVSAATSSSPWTGSFTAVALPPRVDQVKSTTCVNAEDCWAVGEAVGRGATESSAAVFATTNGGRRWMSQPIPAGIGTLNDISCSDRQHCVAVGQSDQTPNSGSAVLVTTNGGATWIAAPPLAGVSDMTTVSCRADRHCLAIGTNNTTGAVYASSPGTSTWTSVGTLPPGVEGASAVSCTDDRHCWVTGFTATDPLHLSGAVVATSNGGSTWTSLPVPAGTGFLNGITCTQGSGDRAAASCVAVGTSAVAQGQTRTGHGQILTSSNAGLSWTPEPVPTAVATLFDVSCPSVGICAAVGSTPAASAQAGVTVLTGTGRAPWQHPTVLTMPLSMSGVWCVSTSNCAVVGGAYTAYLRS
jgi:hypothetical protein